MKLSDLQALNEQFPDNCGRRETIRLDNQSRLLRESSAPQTGIYWWVPYSNSATSWNLRDWTKIERWRLESFLDEEYEKAFHKEIWELYAATILRLDDVELPQEVKEAYHGLPRGRVSKGKQGQYLILHGDDSPVDDLRTVVASRFHLPLANTVAVFDQHETMHDDDVEVVRLFLERLKR